MGPVRHFDLCVIGSGSGNTIIDEQFADRSVAIVEGGTFGGTCLNVGCIPTKMFVYPADLASLPGPAAELGVDLRLQRRALERIRDRIFGRIDPISAGRTWRHRERRPTSRCSSERARFVGPRRLAFGARRESITADRFVLAAGSRPVIPPSPVWTRSPTTPPTR